MKVSLPSFLYDRRKYFVAKIYQDCTISPGIYHNDFEGRSRCCRSPIFLSAVHNYHMKTTKLPFRIEISFRNANRNLFISKCKSKFHFDKMCVFFFNSTNSISKLVISVVISFRNENRNFITKFKSKCHFDKMLFFFIDKFNW